MIKRVYDDQADYTVGLDGVVSIEPSREGPKTVTMYKITYENGEHLFLGLKEHEVVMDE